MGRADAPELHSLLKGEGVRVQVPQEGAQEDEMMPSPAQPQGPNPPYRGKVLLMQNQMECLEGETRLPLYTKPVGPCRRAAQYQGRPLAWKATAVGQGWKPGTFLVVQWLGLQAATAGGMGSIPGQGTRIPRAM